MTENQLREAVKKYVKNRLPTAHLSWVETHATAPGFPDADICSEGIILQLELKVLKGKDLDKIEVRPTQYCWFRDRLRAGGRPMMLVGHDNGYFLLPGESINNPTPLKTLSDLRTRAHWSLASIDDAITTAFEYCGDENE